MNFNQPTTQPAGIDHRKALLPWVFLFFLSAYLLTLKGYPLFADEEIMYQTAINLVEHGSFNTINHPWLTKTGRNGLYYSNYGIGQSVYEAPFYLMGKLAAALLGPEYQNLKVIAVFPAAPLTAACSALLIMILSSALGLSVKRSWSNTLIFGFCTMAYPYSKMLFRDPLQNLFLLASVTALVYHRKQGCKHGVWLAGLSMGCGIMVKETMVIYVPLLILYLVWRKSDNRLRDASILSLPVCLAVVLCLAYNYVRYENIWDFGYVGSNEYGMGTPLIEGLFGLLVSPGKGFFCYNPAAILIFPAFPLMWRRVSRETMLFLAMITVNVLFHVKFWSWGGGWCWGPRYQLMITPYVVIIIGYLFEFRQRSQPTRSALIALLVLSLLVQIPGVIMHIAPYLTLIANDVHLFPLTNEKIIEIRSDLFHVDFVPEFSPIWGLSWTLRHSLTMLYQSRAAIREHMKADCPWRSLSHDWVPKEPDKALGMGPDLLPVMWRFTYPKTLPWLLLLYVADGLVLCASFLAIRKRLPQVKNWVCPT